MEKITYVFLLFITLSQVQAQYGPEVRMGLKAGLNMSTVSGDDLDADFLFAHHIGGFAEIQFSDKIYFVPEMIFSVQGYQSSISTGDVELPGDIEIPGDVELPNVSEGVDQEIRYSYLNFPLMARYNITESFFAEVGPQIGFLMGAKFKSTTSSTIEVPGVDEDGESISVTEQVQLTSELNVRDQHNDLDFGVSLGAGGYLNDHFMLSARYYLGLNEIDNQNMGFSNQVIQFSIGYRF